MERLTSTQRNWIVVGALLVAAVVILGWSFYSRGKLIPEGTGPGLGDSDDDCSWCGSAYGNPDAVKCNKDSMNCWYSSKMTKPKHGCLAGGHVNPTGGYCQIATGHDYGQCKEFCPKDHIKCDPKVGLCLYKQMTDPSHPYCPTMDGGHQPMLDDNLCKAFWASPQ